jgi:hypothetical protein
MSQVDRYVPGQEIVDAVDGVICDAFDDMVKVEFWIEVVEFG